MGLVLASSQNNGVDAPRFSLIIPAHNESARIGKTIVEYLDAFEDSEVLLVLNGCTDDTEAVAYRAALGRPNLRLLHIDHAVGKGGAVRAGFLAARAPIVGYVDADGATSGAEMRRLFNLMHPGIDGVIASRWTRGSAVEVAQPLLRRVASRCFNTIVRLLFGLPFTDTQCGAKVFSTAAISEIAPTLEISNFAFDIDVLYALRRAGRKIDEVPTRWHDVGGSKIRDVPHASRSMLQAMLRLRMQHSLFRYVIPLFDSFWPTSPLSVCNGLSILILSERDPKNSRAGAHEAYLFEVARRLVALKHRVHWIAAGSAGLTPSDEVDGVSITRVGNRFSAHAAVPIAYLRDFRDTFDVIVDVAGGLPFLSPLYSLKPKICYVPEGLEPLAQVPLLGSFLERAKLILVRSFYGKSRLVTNSARVRTDMIGTGIAANRIDVVEVPDVTARAEDRALEESWNRIVATFLKIVFDEAVRSHTRYVRSGDTGWSVLHRESARSKSTTMRNNFEVSSRQ